MKNHQHLTLSSIGRRLLISLAFTTLGTHAVAQERPHSSGPNAQHAGAAHEPAPGFRVLARGASDETAVAKHITRLLSHLVPDASEAQKTSIQTIAKAAFNDLKPLREQSKAVHQARLGILTAATVSRSALEANRVEAARLNGLETTRSDQADADAVDVLTVAQRAKIAELIAARANAASSGKQAAPAR